MERSRRSSTQKNSADVSTAWLRTTPACFNQKLKEWEDYYNYHRPHGRLGGQTPTKDCYKRPGPNLSPANVSHTRSVDAVSTQDSNLRRR